MRLFSNLIITNKTEVIVRKMIQINAISAAAVSVNRCLLKSAANQF